MSRISSVLLSVALAAMCTIGSGCSDGGSKKYGLENNLLDYNELEDVTFTVSGNAYCSKCQEEEIPIEGMEIQLFGEGNHIDSVGLGRFDGLGHFTISNVHAQRGQIIEVQGQVFRESTDGYATAYYGYKEITAPNDDGAVVSLTLHFPSTDSEE